MSPSWWGSCKRRGSIATRARFSWILLLERLVDSVAYDNLLAGVRVDREAVDQVPMGGVPGDIRDLAGVEELALR